MSTAPALASDLELAAAPAAIVLAVVGLVVLAFGDRRADAGRARSL